MPSEVAAQHRARSNVATLTLSDIGGEVSCGSLNVETTEAADFGSGLGENEPSFRLATTL